MTLNRPASLPHRLARGLARGLTLAAALALPMHGPWAQARPVDAGAVHLPVGSQVHLPVGSQVRLPALGESAAEDFNVGTERRLGDQIMAEVRRDPAYFDDPLLLEYVQSLWQPLVAAARARGRHQGLPQRLHVFQQQRVVEIGRVAPHLGHDLVAQAALGADVEILGRAFAQGRQAHLAAYRQVHLAAYRQVHRTGIHRPRLGPGSVHRQGQCGGKRQATGQAAGQAMR